MRTMSIDASTKSSGVAIYEGKELIFYKCLTVSGSNVLDRIKKMTQKIFEVYEEYGADEIIMEDVLPEDVRFNDKTFKALIYLQADVSLKFNEYKKQIIFCTSSHWRSQCGIRTGRGIKRPELKAAAMALVKEKYGIVANDDICDAICIGFAHTQGKNQSSEDDFEFA